MQIQLFTIPVTDTGQIQAEMNKFLRSHKVLEVQQHLVESGTGAYWCFCVRYLVNAYSGYDPAEGKVKIDYKTTLSEEVFKIFSRLREIRKVLATEDTVPAYLVFTDEELAGIAKLENINIQSLQTIKGIGEKKVEKYGSRLIQLFSQPDENK
jgi:superfamily II DNA helicase RecQ